MVISSRVLVEYFRRRGTSGIAVRHFDGQSIHPATESDAYAFRPGGSHQQMR